MKKESLKSALLRKLRCEMLENRELLTATGWEPLPLAADANSALVADALAGLDEIEINGAALEDADVQFSNYDPAARTIDYSWAPLDAADLGYRVQFSRDGGETWLNIANKLTETELSAKGIYVGRTYQFRVLGISSTGTLSEDYLLTSLAPYSTTISNATGVYELDEALSVATKGSADVEVSFQWSRLTDGEFVAIDGATDASYAPSAASGDAGRAIKVVATGVGASTGINYEYEFLPEAPGAATSLSGEYSDGTFTATWSASELAYAYDVYVSTNGGEYELAETTSELTYVATGLVAGNDYAYKVVAKNDAGEAEGVEILCSPLTATVDVNPYSYGDTLTTTLSGANAEATYQWFRRVDGEYFEIADATGAVYTPVAEDAGHFLKVVATGVGASLGSSAEIVVRCVNPATPDGIEFGVYNPKTRSVVMAWSDVEDETSYVIRTSTDGETYKTSSTTPGQNETSTVLKMANPGVATYYEVGARNDAGFSEGYAQASYAPVGLELDKEAFVEGDVLTATTTADAQATLQWYSSTSKDGEWTAIADATGASLTIDASLANSWIKVVATGTSGSFAGAVSEEYAAPKVLAAPSGLNVASYEDGEITLGWSDNSSDETGFEVEFFVDDISRWISFLTVDADATIGTRAASSGAVDYAYRVRAVNAAGYSDWAYCGDVSFSLEITEDAGVFAAVATPDGGSYAGGYSYQWSLDGVAIDGATASTYAMQEGDAGGLLSVTATNDYGVSATAEYQIVAPLAIVVDAETYEVGQTLTASIVGEKATAEFQWNRLVDGEWVAIEGATDAAYQTTADDAGRTLQVVATGTGVSTGETATVSILPIAPTAPATIDGEYVPNTLTVNWTTDANAYEYVVYTSKNGAAFSKAATTSDLSYVASMVYAGNAFTIRVYSKNDAGVSADYAEYEFSPIALSIDVNPYSSGESITATVTPSSATVEYQWYVRVDGEYVAIEGATDATYTPDAATAGRFLKVVATGTGESEGLVKEVIAKSARPTAPTAVSVGAFDVASRTLELTWDDVDFETSYVVKSSKDGSNFVVSANLEQNATTFTAKSLTAGTTYYYRVYARNDAGLSADYAEIVVTPIGLALNQDSYVPGDELVATVTGDAEAIALQWYVASSKDGEWTAIEGATSTNLTVDEEIVDGYWLKLVATGLEGTAYANSVSEALVAPCSLEAPTDFVFAGYASNTATLTWTDNSSAETGFEIVYYGVGSAAGRWIPFITADADATQASRTAPAGSARYVYRIRAISDSGVSQWTYSANAGLSVEIAEDGANYAATVTPASDAYAGAIAYQWYLDGVAVEDATDSVYVRRDGDDGATLTVVATNDYGVSAAAEVRIPQAIEIVVDAETYEVGQTLTATIVSEGATADFQWNRFVGGEWVAIEGATDASYQTTAADAGRKLQVVATGTGASEGKTSKVSVLPTAATAPATIDGDYVPNTLTVTWDAVDNAYEYVVYTSKNGAAFSKAATTSDLSYVASMVYTGNAFTIRVFAKNDAGVSADYAEYVFSPISLSVDANPYSSGETITATVSPSDATVEYQWYVRVDGEYVAIEGATDASYTPDAATAGRFLKVVATGTGASAGTTKEVVVRSALPTAPSALSVGAFDGATRTLELAWDDVDFETSYVVKSSTNGTSFSVSANLDQDATSYVAKSLVAGRTYYYRVYAQNDAGLSADYAEIVVTPIGLALNQDSYVPGDELVATVTGDAEAIALQWYVASSKDGEWTAIEGATSANLTVADDVADGAWLKLVATGLEGTAYANSVTEALVAPCTLEAPTDFVFAGYASNTATLTWTDNSADETGFEIVYYGVGSAAGRWIPFITADADATQASRTAPAGSARYVYRIRAVGDSGVSQWTYSPSAGLDVAIEQEDATFTAVVTPALETYAGAYAYQWYFDGVAVEGANDSTFVLQDSDLVTTLSVVATNDFGISATAEVEVLAPVEIEVSPQVFAVGDVLTATIVSPRATADFQWYRWNDVDEEYVAIDGATDASYQTTAEDGGRIVMVVATGTGVSRDTEDSFAVAPIFAPAPTQISGAYDQATETLTVQWSEVADAYLYDVYLSVDGGEFALVDSLATETSEIANVAPGADYVVKVVGVNDLGEGSEFATFRYSPLALSVDVNPYSLGDAVTATIASSNADATFQWYRIVDGADVAIDGATDATYQTTWDDAGLFLKVVATGTGVSLGSSQEIVVECAAPDAPTDLAVVYDQASTAATLTWASDDVATSYVVAVSVDGETVAEETVTDATFVYSGLVAGSDYEFAVTAQNAAGVSAAATVVYSPVALSVDANPYTLGDAVTATIASSNAEATIQWYRIVDGADVAIDGATDAAYQTTADDAGLFLKVVATGAGVSLGSSQEVVVECATPAAPSASLGVYDSKAKTVEFSWTAETDALSYAVALSVDGGEFAEVGTFGADETSVVLTDLAVGSTYVCRVQAVNAAGASDPTDVSYAPIGLVLNKEAFVAGDVLQATVIGDASATLQWYGATSKDGEWTPIVDATAPTYAVDATDAWLKVVATSAAGATVEEFAAPLALNAPTNLEVLYAEGANTANWNDNSSDETGFQIEVYSQADSRWYAYATAGQNATSVAVESEVDESAEVYRVRAVGDQGYSKWTLTANAEFGVTVVSTYSDGEVVFDAETASEFSYSGNYSYQWFVDGEALDGATQSWINEPTGVAGGVISVKAVNDYGVEVEDEIQLIESVSVADDQFAPADAQGRLQVTKYATLTATVAPSNATGLRYFWTIVDANNGSTTVEGTSQLSLNDYYGCTITLKAVATGNEFGGSVVAPQTYVVGPEAASTCVTSFEDKIDDADGKVTLREAIDVYSVQLGESTITFSDQIDWTTGTIKLSSQFGAFAVDHDLTINAEGQGVAIDADGASRIFTIATEDASALNVSLVGLTLQNGDSQDEEGKSGGAVYASNANLTIEECAFENNVAPRGGYGSALYVEAGSLTVDRSKFVDNGSGTTNGAGELGAVAVGRGINANFYSSLFANNQAFQGGGVYLEYNAVATLWNCTFAANAAGTNGGTALYAPGKGTVSFYNSILYDEGSAYAVCAPQIDAVYFYGTVTNTASAPANVIKRANYASYIAPSVGMLDSEYRLNVSALSETEYAYLIDSSRYALPESMTKDLDGNDRVVDYKGDGAYVDFGCYELQSSSNAVDDAFAEMLDDSFEEFDVEF